MSPAPPPVRGRAALRAARRAGPAAVLALAGALAGCRPQRPPGPPAENPFATQAYADDPPNPEARVFLVAGGDDVANFAAEVLEQRTLWRRAGIPESQLACYYAKPTPDAWRRDHAQYTRLARALKSCRQASVQTLRRDLAAAAASAPPFVFVYITSHGLASQLGPSEGPPPARMARFVASLSPEARALLDAPAIGLDGGAHPGLGDPRRLAAALRRGVPPEDILLTPQTLAPMLGAFGAQTTKIVVLQACFSGGFVGHRAPPGGAQGPDGPAGTLQRIENLTVLTASAAERPSFGCSAGLERTYFGGAFNTALKHALAPDLRPDTVDWEAVYEQARFAVAAMEYVGGQQPSLPGFYRSPPAPSPLQRPELSAPGQVPQNVR